MTPQTTPTPAVEEKPVWQRYLPAGAAATVAVAAIIGIQAASSDGSAVNGAGPGQGGPPGMQSQGQQQVPGTSDGTSQQQQQQQQVPPWNQDGATGAPPAPPGMDGQAAPSQSQGQQSVPGQSQQAVPDQGQGLASPRTNVS